jgi:hypothetical protein
MNIIALSISLPIINKHILKEIEDYILDTKSK